MYCLPSLPLAHGTAGMNMNMSLHGLADLFVRIAAVEQDDTNANPCTHNCACCSVFQTCSSTFRPPTCALPSTIDCTNPPRLAPCIFFPACSCTRPLSQWKTSIAMLLMSSSTTPLAPSATWLWCAGTAASSCLHGAHIMIEMHLAIVQHCCALFQPLDCALCRTLVHNSSLPVRAFSQSSMHLLQRV